jgi:hypothetical protein
MGYICEVRRETGLELCREFDVGGRLDVLLVGSGRAEAGTEFRSGAMSWVWVQCACVRVDPLGPSCL